MKRILSRVVPRSWRWGIKMVKTAGDAERYLANLRWQDNGSGGVASESEPNPLAAYVDRHREGRGVWKWKHYFEIYHRHLKQFVGRPVNVVEIGIYSGGSLDMWRDYFGGQCRIYGIDIEPACKAYEREGVRVMIGDQADRQFWKRFRAEVPNVDVVIDDGGHTTHQQTVTFEEMLPHLRPGGVYLCEDVVGDVNRFACYVQRLALALNVGALEADQADRERSLHTRTSPLQRHVHSIHSYPFVSVVERNRGPVEELLAPKRGTEWQPFL